MHLLHIQPDDNHHDASSASPALMRKIMTTLPLPSPMVSNATLEMCCIERDADEYDDDDFIEDKGERDDDFDDNCPAVIMISM